MLFFSEDELRKQADTFTGKVNIRGVTYTPPRTGQFSLSWFFSVGSGPPCLLQVVITRQNAPSTDKRLREDLYKKVVSGDPVAARLLYAILTKMVTFSGWKRFELNETLKFHGVTEMTFPSIMRRSLILDCKGRFVCAQRLASLLPDTQGHFLMQEDMKDFVTSQPAAGLFTVVLGELCDFGVATFRQKIGGYTEGGGDGGLTRATTRVACGLHLDSGHGVAPWPAAGVVETLAARQVPGCWATKRGLSSAMWLGVPRQQVAPPAKDRVGTLQQLKARGWWKAYRRDAGPGRR